jgi:hypothetical protein
VWQFGYVFYDILCTAGKDPIMLVANPTTDKLWAAINMLAPVSVVGTWRPSSSDSAAANILQAFNFEAYLQDFSASALQAPTAGEPAPSGTNVVLAGIATASRPRSPATPLPKQAIMR